jgi:hypothetical protein
LSGASTSTRRSLPGRDGQQDHICGSWKALAEGDYRWVVEIDGDTEGFGAVFANVLNFDPTFDIVTT